MTESLFQAKLLTKLRRRLKDAVVWKLSDRFNGGIPDVAVVSGKRTTWFELKVAPNRPSQLQQYYLDRIGGHLVTLHPDTSFIMIDATFCKTFEAAIEVIVGMCK